MRKTRSYAAAGLLLLLGTAFLAVVTQPWATRTYSLFVWFPSGSGLRPGSVVNYQDSKIGEVVSIDLGDGNGEVVEMQIHGNELVKRIYVPLVIQENLSSGSRNHNSVCFCPAETKGSSLFALSNSSKHYEDGEFISHGQIKRASPRR